MSNLECALKERSALFITKQTLKAYIEENAESQAHLRRLLEQEHPEYEKIVRSNREHEGTIEKMVETLQKLGFSCRFLARKPGEIIDTCCEELIVTVGGDGTFLDASHSINRQVKVLGVNSAPSSSIGHYCLADRDSFERIMNEICSGEKSSYPLRRLRMRLNGEQLPVFALNEVYISDSSPAGTARYRIDYAGASVEHKSSGLIIATAAGSTGFNLSAGGSILDITDNQGCFSTLAPYLPPGQSRDLVRGTFREEEVIQITSKMLEGCFFIDGKHIRYDFSRGSQLEIDLTAPVIDTYIDPARHEPYRQLQTGSNQCK